MNRLRIRSIGIPLLITLALTAIPGSSLAQESVTLAEQFRPGQAYKVDVQVRLTGKLAVPLEKGKPPQLVTLVGVSHLVYDERVLTPDEPGTTKTVRAYREVEFRRALGNVTQDAGIRPSVRRMVVMRAAPPPGSDTPPRKAPFSPDGPLTWGEIDVVRTDVFLPSVVPGLLPGAAVRPEVSWKATAAAVLELTDMEKVDEGGLAVKFLGVTTVDGRRVAKLGINGTVRGVNEDGPNRQKLDGTAYYDLGSNLLTYLSVRGTHELLDGNGQPNGAVEGQFIMTRTPLAQPPVDLSDAALGGMALRPDAENTLLLYDDPKLGVRFLYPRSWRVGAVQGKQVTIEQPRLGGGILVTMEPATKVPAPEDYLKEVTAFLQKEKAQITGTEAPKRVRTDPVLLDRFALDAVIGEERVRMEYAVLKQSDGGATFAARIPATAAPQLQPEVERIIRSLSVTKRIE
jgi:hypothetical protein